MSEESNERYSIEITQDAVHLWDGEKPVTSFCGGDRLLNATAELNRLKEREELGAPDVDITGTFSSTPAAFLAETLPAVARRQRLEGHLAEVREIRESLATVVAEQTANLDRALALERKLMKALSAETRFGKSSAELDTPSAPLSATEAAQNAPEVPLDAPSRFKTLRERQKAEQALREQRATPTVAGGAEKLQVLAERELSKPGPY